MASSLTCPICVDSYGDDSNDVCSTICGHIFHFTCLLEWQEHSNTCPMCNRNNPQPHRIFIDMKAVTAATTNNEEQFNVIVKGVQPNQMTPPLSTVVLKLCRIMQVHIQERDIGNVSKIANTLYVSFKNARHKDAFLANKYKLRHNIQTSKVAIHEMVNAETKALFQYAHKLKAIEYKIFFIKNKKVYVRKDKISNEIEIFSKEHVDRLIADVRNKSPDFAPSAPSYSTVQDEIPHIYARNPGHTDDIVSIRSRYQSEDIAESNSRQRQQQTEDQISCCSSFKKLFTKIRNKFRRN